MSDAVAILVMVVGVVGFFGGLVWMARRIRRSRKATSAVSGAMAAYQQAYDPNAVKAHNELSWQEQRSARTAISDDIGRS